MQKNEFFSTVQTNAIKVKPQYLTFLTMVYVTLTLVGCPLLFKLVKLGPITAPGGLLPLPIVLLIEDVVAEIYGYRISRALLWYLLISMLIFIYTLVYIAHLPSPSYWHYQAAFNTVFNPLDKGVTIMVLGIFTGRFFNLYVITKLKILVRGRLFWLRSIFSTLVGDMVSLSIIYGFVFWSMPFSDKAHYFLSDISVRVTYSIIGVIPAVFVVKFLKKKENIDVYDLNTNFNPFKLKCD